MDKFIIAYLLIVNSAAFLLCFLDKRAAILKRWRIKERTLLIFAAAGGAVGLYLSMSIFRHKTKHFKFTLGVPLIFVIQCVAVWKLILPYTL